MSELERESILQRQKEGIAVEHAKGIYRRCVPMTYDKEKLNQWYMDSRTNKEQHLAL